MSYDIDLVDPVTKETINLPENHMVVGGTYAVGGTTELHLNVTYNYHHVFVGVLGNKGIRSIYGMTGADSVPVLQAAADRLGDDVVDDYWQPTEGNAKRAILGLLSFARLRPDGIWQGD